MTICYTGGMSTVKVAISIEQDVLATIDRLVDEAFYPNRSKAIQDAVIKRLARLSKSRLLRECQKLDANAEQEMADEFLSGESKWPEF